MKGYAPCGMCAALVPAATGCAHWRPATMSGTSASDRAARERAKRAAWTPEQRETARRKDKDRHDRAARARAGR